MNNENKPESRLSRFLDAVFAYPGIKIAALLLLALASVVLLVRLGTNPDKDLMLTQTPIVCAIAFLAVYFIMWVQSKNYSSRGLDVFELIVLVLFAAGALYFGIKYALDIKRGYLPTFPGLLVCLCSLTLFHSRRKDK